MNEEEKHENSANGKSFRLGKTSRIILIVGIFLVLFVPLLLLYRQQSAQQAVLDKELSSVQKLISASVTRKTVLEAQTRQAEKEIQAAKNTFATVDDAPEILGDLLALAKANDIMVAGSKAAMTKQTYKVGKQKAECPVLEIQLSFRGQVPKLQNFLAGLDTKFPMSEVKSLSINVAQKKDEQDKASATIYIYCLDGSN